MNERRTTTKALIENHPNNMTVSLMPQSNVLNSRGVSITPAITETRILMDLEILVNDTNTFAAAEITPPIVAMNPTNQIMPQQPNFGSQFPNMNTFANEVEIQRATITNAVTNPRSNVCFMFIHLTPLTRAPRRMRRPSEAAVFGLVKYHGLPHSIFRITGPFTSFLNITATASL